MPASAGPYKVGDIPTGEEVHKNEHAKDRYNRRHLESDTDNRESAESGLMYISEKRFC